MKKNFKNALMFSSMAIMSALSISSAIPTFAAGWEKDTTGWKYYIDVYNTNWYCNTWQWLDGNGDGVAECYNFNSLGYLCTNTTTSDGCTVNADGAWTQNGVVQTKSVTPFHSGIYGISDGVYNGIQCKPSDSNNSDNDNVDISEYARQCFDLINEERVSRGLEELEWDDSIAEACDIRAEELSEKYSHTRPDGSDFDTVFDETGVIYHKTRGENIAAGYTSPKMAASGWMKSTKHKDNILYRKFKRSAIGCYYDPNTYKYYWVQDFTD